MLVVHQLVRPAALARVRVGRHLGGVERNVVLAARLARAARVGRPQELVLQVGDGEGVRARVDRPQGVACRHLGHRHRVGVGVDVTREWLPVGEHPVVGDRAPAPRHHRADRGGVMPAAPHARALARPHRDVRLARLVDDQQAGGSDGRHRPAAGDPPAGPDLEGLAAREGHCRDLQLVAFVDRGDRDRAAQDLVLARGGGEGAADEFGDVRHLLELHAEVDMVEVVAGVRVLVAPDDLVAPLLVRGVRDEVARVRATRPGRVPVGEVGHPEGVDQRLRDPVEVVGRFLHGLVVDVDRVAGLAALMDAVMVGA